ncbi:hypothetical protein [Xanthomonas arboricola]|uniref:hypothetical protein n=1 Tax=Xanthomonas arboricola TaxID=56448 RepID=UPI00215818A7|nr:hypothetical protein [Xanthomonas arboricola]
MPSGTIVCIHSRVRYASYHYLLKVPGGYMDPCFDLKKGIMAARLRAELPKNTKLIVKLAPAKIDGIDISRKHKGVIHSMASVLEIKFSPLLSTQLQSQIS